MKKGALIEAAAERLYEHDREASFRPIPSWAYAGLQVQSQYCDRAKVVVDFLAALLACDSP